MLQPLYDQDLSLNFQYCPGTRLMSTDTSCINVMLTRPLIPNANINNWIQKASLGSTTIAANKDMGATRTTGVHFSQQCLHFRILGIHWSN